MAVVLATGMPRTDTYRVRHRDGHYVWIEAVARSIPADDGSDGVDIMQTARNISRRKAAEQALAENRLELERLSRVDPLTDLANRRQFDERFAQALKRLQRHGTPIALLCMDIDHFKRINDGWGHEAGDHVLRAVAAELSAHAREHDQVARFGGEEFCLMVPDLDDEALTAYFDRLRQRIEDLDVAAPAGLMRVTVSIGVRRARPGDDLHRLLAEADRRLYLAKAGGRNRVVAAG